MNEKGVMFTLMTMLLILSVMALNETAKNMSSEKQDITAITSFMTVGNRFNNISRNMIDLKKFGASRLVSERVLPFRYEMDSNWVKIKRIFPVDSYEMETYFDTINLYALFTEEQTVSPAADINTVQNSYWQGSARDLAFLLEPFCYQYKFYDLNMMRFEPSTSQKCQSSFNFSDLNIFETNVKVAYIDDDYNLVRCNGSVSCPSQAYDETNTNPYYVVTIYDSECSQCNLSTTRVGSHITSSESMLIEITCDSDVCSNNAVEITINKNISGIMEVMHQGPRIVDVNTTIGFEGGIDRFDFLDFNVTVQSKDGKSLQTNNPSVLN